MYYALGVAALFFAVLGVTRAGGARQSYGLPWGSLLLWALLFGAGYTLWKMAGQLS